ncbi:cysteine desulfurase SufS, pyridoxal 5'-phosphate (PLP)-dependent [Acetobacter orientalis]|uniref:Cysteine desulfurase SufS, pyridoxal 5'-phosphate (PLP)-dependent n=1 Tax=Acetobacter orientalis TaxID=146474 RepID=A0A2Z5ZIW7_9PROT|nr:cysteine desulfurase SufS, pyridoxal 5'-phosphate (PLP)-dependent [Acetobacter orientalis]
MLLQALHAGHELEKPGWVRLNFSVLMSDEKVRYIIDAVNELANSSAHFIPAYQCDAATARFRHKLDL